MSSRPDLLTDLRLGLRRSALRAVYALETDLRRRPGPGGPVATLDVRTISGVENLGQAIVIRLLTPRDELAALGHPGFGSRLHELVGAQNTETNRNLAKLYILESLALEPRIAEVVELTVRSDERSRHLVDVLLRVRPVGAEEVVTIGPFSLEFEQ